MTIEKFEAANKLKAEISKAELHLEAVKAALHESCEIDPETPLILCYYMPGGYRNSVGLFGNIAAADIFIKSYVGFVESYVYDLKAKFAQL